MSVLVSDHDYNLNRRLEKVEKCNDPEKLLHIVEEIIEKCMNVTDFKSNMKKIKLAEKILKIIDEGL